MSTEGETPARAEALELLDQATAKLLRRVLDGDVARLQPAQAARMLGQLARARRDLAASGEATPAEAAGAAADPALELRRETVAEWNRRHAVSPAEGPTQ